MATIYNKTALKKVKKDELIQMFLDLQAQRINDSMDEAVEKCCNNAIEEVVEGLKAENEKLKKQNAGWVKRSQKVRKSNNECVQQKVEIIMKLKEENEKLKEEIERSTIKEVRSARDKAIQKLAVFKAENKKLKEELDDWHKALNEPVEGLEHLQSGINLHFWQRCSGPWDADIEKINQK